MNTRIKEARKAAGMTQQQLADKIGIKQNSVAQIELGKRMPSRQVILSICRELNVSEQWLTDGTGQMFAAETRDEEIADFLTDVLKDEPEAFRKRMISVLARLDVKDWELLERTARELLKG